MCIVVYNWIVFKSILFGGIFMKQEHCSKCGHVLNKGDRFCKECGKEISPVVSDDNIKTRNFKQEEAVSIKHKGQFKPLLSSNFELVNTFYLADFFVSFFNKFVAILFLIVFLGIFYYMSTQSKAKEMDVNKSLKNIYRNILTKIVDLTQEHQKTDQTDQTMENSYSAPSNTSKATTAGPSRSNSTSAVAHNANLLPVFVLASSVVALLFIFIPGFLSVQVESSSFFSLLGKAKDSLSALSLFNSSARNIADTIDIFRIMIIVVPIAVIILSFIKNRISQIISFVLSAIEFLTLVYFIVQLQQNIRFFDFGSFGIVSYLFFAGVIVMMITSGLNALRSHKSTRAN